MKNLYLLLLAISFSFLSYSQTLFFKEEINSSENWEIEDDWLIEYGVLDYTLDQWIFEYYEMTAISPEFYVPDNADNISVKHHLDVFTPADDDFVSISIFYDENEEVLWSQALSAGDWGIHLGQDMIFDASNFAGKNVKLKFKVYGTNTVNFRWWRIYEYSVYCSFNKDIAIESFIGPNNIEANQMGDWTVTLKNFGSETINNYEIVVYEYVENEVIYSEAFNDAIPGGESKQFSFQWSSSTPKSAILKAEVSSAEDEFVNNNTTAGLFVRVEPENDYNVLVWDNDNDYTPLLDPEDAIFVEGLISITKPLDLAGIQYEILENLPNDLSVYDVVFIALGTY